VRPPSTSNTQSSSSIVRVSVAAPCRSASNRQCPAAGRSALSITRRTAAASTRCRNLTTSDSTVARRPRLGCWSVVWSFLHIPFDQARPRCCGLRASFDDVRTYPSRSLETRGYVHGLYPCRTATQPASTERPWSEGSLRVRGKGRDLSAGRLR
jgi:hypothetical protein